MSVKDLTPEQLDQVLTDVHDCPWPKLKLETLIEMDPASRKRYYELFPLPKMPERKLTNVRILEETTRHLT